MYNYKLTIAYDGTNYHGWQIQPNGISIQELIQTTLWKVTHCQNPIIGAGRTDAGVHAIGQVAHYKCDKELDLHRLILSLNGLLPKDIRILAIENVPLDFHAQRHAVRKTYHYHLFLDPSMNPFRRLYTYHVHGNCDLDLLKKAANFFVGTHDFTSFANEAHSGSAAHNAVRTMERLEVVPEEGGVRLEFTANGFLYKMVRNIVGTILEVAKGKKELEDIPVILAAKDRRLAGQAAPPQGLFLVSVEYRVSKEA